MTSFNQYYLLFELTFQPNFIYIKMDKRTSSENFEMIEILTNCSHLLEFSTVDLNPLSCF